MPFWIGGHGAAALRRVAAVGDVWFPHMYGSSPEVLRERIARIDEQHPAARHESRVSNQFGFQSESRLASQPTVVRVALRQVGPDD